MNYYLLAFKKIADTKTRSNRREYWYFFLINFIISMVIAALVYFLNNKLLVTVYEIIIILPAIAVAIRRLHDINKSGWWYLIVLLPIVGWIWLIVLLAKEGDKGPNNYGDESFA